MSTRHHRRFRWQCYFCACLCSCLLAPAVLAAGGQNASTGPDWETVGYWDYDGVDGAELQHGLILQRRPGAGLGKRWQRHLELRNHGQLRKRPRTLWPVDLSRHRRRVCVDYPGYPTYEAYIDLPSDEHDGRYKFGPCSRADRR